MLGLLLLTFEELASLRPSHDRSNLGVRIEGFISEKGRERDAQNGRSKDCGGWCWMRLGERDAAVVACLVRAPEATPAQHGAIDGRDPAARRASSPAFFGETPSGTLRRA